MLKAQSFLYVHGLLTSFLWTLPILDCFAGTWAPTAHCLWLLTHPMSSVTAYLSVTPNSSSDFSPTFLLHLNSLKMLHQFTPSAQHVPSTFPTSALAKLGMPAITSSFSTPNQYWVPSPLSLLSTSSPVSLWVFPHLTLDLAQWSPISRSPLEGRRAECRDRLWIRLWVWILALSY